MYILFRSVIERGGIQEVMEKRRFREILRCLQLSSTNSVIAYMVKNQYMKDLHAYEVKMKDALLKQWKKTITLGPQDMNPNSGVPTIALNDSLKDMKQQNNHAFRPPNQQIGIPT